MDFFLKINTPILVIIKKAISFVKVVSRHWGNGGGREAGRAAVPALVSEEHQRTSRPAGA